MNNRSRGNQTQLALMAGIVIAVLILIAFFVTRERQGLPSIGASPARGPAPEDFVPLQSDSARVRALLAQARPTSTPVVERSYEIRRAQIVEDVIVHLERVEFTNKGLRIEYAMEPFEPPESFFRSLFNRKDAAVMEIGKPNIRFPDGHISVSDGYDVERDSGAISFFDDSRTPVAGEVVNVSMGSGTISAPELAGNVTIPLPTKYGDVEHGQEVRREAYLVIEDAQYAVSLERLGRNYHRVILTPANHTAKRTELVYAGDRIEDRPGVRVEGASLTAAFSDSLNFYRKATIFDGDLDNPLINSMEFEFAGHIPPTATSLTFSVQGGSRIRGPFIFEGVHLVPR